MASDSGYGWSHSANCSNLRREGAKVLVDVSTSGSSSYSGTLYIDGNVVGTPWRNANGGSSSDSKTLEWNNPGPFSNRSITCRMTYQIGSSGSGGDTSTHNNYLYPETGSLGALQLTVTFNPVGGTTPTASKR